jgi:undecaprenyl pyrophosphate phosphatase UppP
MTWPVVRRKTVEQQWCVLSSVKSMQIDCSIELVAAASSAAICIDTLTSSMSNRRCTVFAIVVLCNGQFP